MTLHDKLSRNMTHFYGATLDDLTTYLTSNPTTSIVAPDFGELLSSEIVLFMNDNPDVVADGILDEGGSIRITGISGSTRSFDETARFNSLVSGFSEDFYMKGQTVLAFFKEEVVK